MRARTSWGIHGHFLPTVETGRISVMKPKEKFIISAFVLNLTGVQFFILAFLAEHAQRILDAANSELRNFAKHIATETTRIRVPTPTAAADRKNEQL
jgi:hypothetical protein